MNRSVLSQGTLPFSQLPDEAFIRQKTLLQLGLIPWSAASLWRKCRSNQFPQPIKISPGVTAWRVREIREWAVDPAGYRPKKGMHVTTPGLSDSEASVIKTPCNPSSHQAARKVGR